MDIYMNNTDILDLGLVLDPEKFLKYIDETRKFDILLHKYGEKMQLFSHPCWMEYIIESDQKGSISFTRHTHKNPVLSEMVSEILEILKKILPDTISLNPERVHFIKTKGNIVKHKDESGRLTCINIGIKNSSTAITKISNDGDYDNFEYNNTEHVIKEGHAYLLNTNQYHSVESDVNCERYLITYGFGIEYDVLSKMIIDKKNDNR